jgi:hypothetical protein
VNWPFFRTKQRASPLTPDLRRRIRASFEEAARDEEHFISTIDPGGEARPGHRLRQGPVRPHPGRALSQLGDLGARPRRVDAPMRARFHPRLRRLRRSCRRVASRFISYWEDVPPDGLFLAWLAER